MSVDKNLRSDEISIVKKIAASLAVTMIVQLFGAIWWASAVNTNLSYMRIDISSMKEDIKRASQDRYRTTDAEKDLFKLEAKIEKNSKDIEKLREIINRTPNN